MTPGARCQPHREGGVHDEERGPRKTLLVARLQALRREAVVDDVCDGRGRDRGYRIGGQARAAAPRPQRLVQEGPEGGGEMMHRVADRRVTPAISLAIGRMAPPDPLARSVHRAGAVARFTLAEREQGHARYERRDGAGRERIAADLREWEIRRFGCGHAKPLAGCGLELGAGVSP